MKAIFQKLRIIFISLILGLILIALPLLMVVSFISLGFTDNKTFLSILAYIAGITAVVGVVFFLINNPKTAKIAKPIFAILVVALLVKTCMSQSGSSSCTPTRYIECDY